MALLSEIPPEVLSGELRGAYAPEIKVKGSTFVDNGQETAAAIMSDELEPGAAEFDSEGGELAQGVAVKVVKRTRKNVVKSTVSL
jgi:hypothetical protein